MTLGRSHCPRFVLKLSQILLMASGTFSQLGSFSAGTLGLVAGYAPIVHGIRVTDGPSVKVLFLILRDPHVLTVTLSAGLSCFLQLGLIGIVALAAGKIFQSSDLWRRPLIGETG